MTPWLFVVIAIEGGAIAAMWLRSKGLKDELAHAEKNLETAGVLWAQRAANYEDALKRRDELEKGLHAELEALLSDDARDSSPGAVRVRLGRLLRGTATAEALATQSGLPPKPTT